ncbi:MAG: rhomboid family intramembrane serine protease, partial [Candidatus Riflebacteria bacterium]
MDMAYRLVMYILMANVGYMIFSLFRKGYRHYSGYISQLFTLLIVMVFLIAYDVQGGVAIAVSFTGIFLIVIVPMFLQRQIDVLMAENRLAEIEPLARWKANLAWSELNIHLHRITQVAEEMLDDPIQLEQEIRKLLDKGEPYDSMTRVFIGLIHFNNRNFEGMVRDLVVAGKSVDEYNFEELLYLVRAYLELTRYEEAIEAQIALEKKIGDPEDYSPEKRANLVISRMIFFAFLGWRDDMEVLMSSQEDGIEKLPVPIRDFWKGVCCFNAGSFDEGEKIMGGAMRSCEESEEAENWLPFMRKRFFGLIENREFIASRLLTQLEKLRHEYTQVFNQLLVPDREFVADQPERSDCTNILVWVIGIVSSMLMFYMNIEDLVTLIRVGANSSFLVGEGEVFRLFTCLFVHIGWVHLFMNIVALKYFGPPVETVTGWPLFLGIYFFSGLTGSLAAVYSGQILSAGASSAVLGLLSSAIILEVFKVKGADKLANQNNFSTLVFILAINLVIGAVEKGVDNSAHLGGLAGGAILSLFLVPVLRHHLLKSLVTVISVCFVTVFAGFSIFSLVQYQSSGGYPGRVSHFKSLTNASQTFELELPAAWKIDEPETNFQEISVVGPFRERFTAMFEISDKPSEALIDEHINQRTAELEKTPELSLKLRKGPEL